MKYIRTKDGRVVDNELMCIDFANNNILKQADTIEELCDEYVIIVGNEYPHYLHAKYFSIDKTFYIYKIDKKTNLEECLRFNYVVYGAIWTDKGLIYVAKMNDKGESKLL